MCAKAATHPIYFNRFFISEEGWGEEGKSYFYQLPVYLHWPGGLQDPSGGARPAGGTGGGRVGAAGSVPPGTLSLTPCVSTTRKLEKRRGGQTRCSQKRLPW